MALYDHDRERFCQPTLHLSACVYSATAKTEFKAVAYASRSLSETERRYAQIEKEALAIIWGAEKFSNFLVAKKFLVETDLKPLIPLLGSKSLDSLPTREQRFRIRLFRFDFDITHVCGKQLVAADTLLRQPLSESTDKLLEGEVKQYVCVFCCPFQLRVLVYNKSFICNMKTQYAAESKSL